MQLGKVRRRKVFAGQQRHGNIRHLTDVFKVFQWIKRELFVQRWCRGHAHVVQEDGVPIGRSACHFGRANRAARADCVFNQHGLPE